MRLGNSSESTCSPYLLTELAKWKKTFKTGEKKTGFKRARKNMSFLFFMYSISQYVKKIADVS